MAESSGWSALFLSAVSPGMVVQFLERQKRTLESGPAELLLSDAVGECSWRVLACGSADRAWMEAIGPALSRAFAPRVTLVWRGESEGGEVRWGFQVWSDGESGEQGEAEVEAPRKSGFLASLTSRGASESPEAAWAAARGLPIDRVPMPGKRSARIVDFVLVARLDQKGLLVEKTPQLYRFPLYAAPASKPQPI